MTEKDRRVKKEFDRLQEYFADVPAHQRAVALKLVQNCAFMAVTLEDLQAQVNEDGATEAYQHGGGQSGMKESAALQSYNALIKNYTAATKALCGLLPDEKTVAKKHAPSKLAAFNMDAEA